MGNILPQKVGKWKVIHLVTKQRYNDKPSIETLDRCFEKLQEYVITNKIKKLAIPKLGCGRDGHSWPAIKYILLQRLKTTSLEKLVICS